MLKKFESYNNVNNKLKSKFPIMKCTFKNRVPNPGICVVKQINYDEEKIYWSNGYVSSVANFEDVDIYICLNHMDEENEHELGPHYIKINT
ncbi:hypothetical protein M0Q50_08870 [bacterium]|jgi:hypothetical protein|nr:hypothetical protein [bacterium]